MVLLVLLLGIVCCDFYLVLWLVMIMIDAQADKKSVIDSHLCRSHLSLAGL